MREEQIKGIREKCIEANPEIVAERHWNSAGCGKITEINMCRPIRLADVLLAMNETKRECNIVLNTAGHFLQEDDEGPIATDKWWNLRADDLDQQSDECISFIHLLLNV